MEKGWIQVTLTGCSRSSKTRAQWTDVRAAGMDKIINQVNNMRLSQEDQH